MWLGLCVAPCWAQRPLASFECENPLFRGHWFSDREDAVHLSAKPVAYDNLVRCRMWNRHASCCTPSMEVAQQLAFDCRREEFENKVAMLRDYLAQLNDIRSSEVYVRASDLEKALLDRAQFAFGPVLRHAAGCTRALLTFAAGMICFGCDPEWHEYVWRDASGRVTGVKIDGESCIYVDQHCGAFGRAAIVLVASVMESSLAKVPTTALPDLSMLRDRETACAWLRGSLAMRPLLSFPPSALVARAGAARRLNASAEDAAPAHEAPTWVEDALDARASSTQAPPPDEASRVPRAPPYATEPRAALDPVKSGEQSGFGFPTQEPPTA